MSLSRGSSAACGLRPRSPSFNGDLGLEDLFQEQFESEEDETSLWDFLALAAEKETAEEEAEILKQEMEDKKREAEEKKREAEEKKRKEESVWRREKHESVVKSIREYDPKVVGVVWTRYFFENFSTFDIDEESPVPPMRNTGKNYLADDKEDFTIVCSANILSIKIVSSDVGYPINVFGTVIVRDSLDRKCNYLFRCNRRDSQLIKSEDTLLILTGPSQGLVFVDSLYLEVDLKIKGERGQDKSLSKCLLEFDGQVVTRQNIEVRRHSRQSMLSTVEVEYAAVKKAVEATIEFQVTKGDFFGKITAETTSIPYEMLLYNSERGGVVTSDGDGTIQLWRRVVAVCLNDMLIFKITNTDVKNGTAADSSRRIDFTAKLGDEDNYHFYCGGAIIHVKVTWSVINYDH